MFKKLTSTQPLQLDLAALTLRLGFGFFMAFGHGWGKFSKLTAGKEITMDTLPLLPGSWEMALAFFAEFICCVLIMIGLRTKWASIPMIITMLVAAFKAHASHPLFFMAADKGPNKEFALIYLFGFLAIFLLGSGKYSVDYLIKKK